MLRRRTVAGTRGPGLASTMARTAVIAGTATAASGAVASKQQQKMQAAANQQAQQQSVAQMQQQLNELQAQQVQAHVPAAAPAAVAAAGGDLVAQLVQLGQLKESGILSDEEFNVAKSKLLGQ